MKQFSLVTTFDLNDRFSSRLRQMTGELGGFGRTLQQTTPGIDRLDSRLGQISRSTADFVNRMAHRDWSVRMLRGSVHVLGSVLTSTTGQLLGLAGAAGGLYAVQRGVKGIVETNAKFEDFGVMLKTLFQGDATKAQAALGWISRFAERTPYEIDAVTDAFVRLQAVTGPLGFDLTKDRTLEILGNAAAALKKELGGANGIVEAVKDAITGENERLKEFLIRAEKLTLKAQGKPTTGFLSANVEALDGGDRGKVRYSLLGQSFVADAKNQRAIIEGLLGLFDKAYPNAMLELSRTWHGVMSNMLDSFTRFELAIGKAGFFETIKGKLVTLQGRFGDFLNTPRGAAAARQISDVLSRVTDGVFKLGELLVAGRFGDFFTEFERQATRAWSAFMDRLSPGQQARFTKFFERVGIVAHVAGRSIDLFGRILGDLGRAADFVSGGRGDQVLAWLGTLWVGARLFFGTTLIGLVLGAGKTLLSLARVPIWAGLGTAASVAFTGILTAGKVLFAGLRLAALGVFSPAGLIAAAGAAVYGIVTHWDTIERAAAATWDKVKVLGGETLEGLAQAFGQWTTRVGHEWDKLAAAATTWAGTTGGAWDALQARARAAWESASATGAGWWSQLSGRAGDLWQRLGEGLAGVWNTAGEVAQGWLVQLVERADAAVTKLTRAFEAGIARILHWFKALPDTVREIDFAAVGHRVGDQLLDGLRRSGPRISDWFGGLFEAPQPAAGPLPALGRVPYQEAFTAAEQRYGLPSGLLARMAKTESSFNPRAVSTAGARGLMQFMPGTAERYGLRNRLDPYASIDAAGRYMADLMRLFGGRLPLAVAAYNAGEGAVKKHGGIPPYRETREYVDKVLGARQDRTAALLQPGGRSSGVVQNDIRITLDDRRTPQVVTQSRSSEGPTRTRVNVGRTRFGGLS